MRKSDKEGGNKKTNSNMKKSGAVNNPYNSNGGNGDRISINKKKKDDMKSGSVAENVNSPEKKQSGNDNNYTVLVQPPDEEDEFVLDNDFGNDGTVNNNGNNVLNENPNDAKRTIARREELEKVKIRKTQANTFEKYIKDTGIATAFQLIFSEIITKKIPIEDHYSYAAGRLRQIGRDIDDIKLKSK